MFNQMSCNSMSRVVFGKLFSSVLSAECITQYRTLYAPASLGIDQYVQVREKTEMHFANSQDRFKSKMLEFSEENSSHMIFTEDLKSMVHIAGDNDSDLVTVKAMMKKFNKQNKEVRFGSFVFGPVVMRMYHYLNKPKEALEAFKDESLNQFFDQITSYHILMDLLFVNNMYNEMIEVFYMVKEKQVQVSRFPKNVVVLFIAACYKLNTAESFKLVTDVWQELKTAGHHPLRRATTFAAMLALNQNAPHIALELISTESRQSYITVRNIKAGALADLGRVEDTLPILRSMLHGDDSQFRRHTITNDIMQIIKAAVGRTTDKEVVAEFQRLEKQLEAHQLISQDNLDAQLCSEIAPPQNFNLPPQNERILSYSYNRRSERGGSGAGPGYRPGLVDLN